MPGAAPSCDGYVYFDTIHPTEQLHAAIATGLIGLQLVQSQFQWNQRTSLLATAVRAG